MSAPVTFSSPVKTARANAYVNQLAGGYLIIYTEGSSAPANADIAISDQVALIRFDLSSPAGSVTNGVFTCDSIAPQMALESGIAFFARGYTSGDAAVCDLSVGAQGSGSAVEINDINIIQGGYNMIVSFNIAEG